MLAPANGFIASPGDELWDLARAATRLRVQYPDVAERAEATAALQDLASGFDPGVPRAEIPGIRRAEQQRAASLLGVSEVVFFSFGEQNLLDDRRELHENLIRVIRQMRPQRVLTWSPEWNWRRFHSCHPCSTSPTTSRVTIFAAAAAGATSAPRDEIPGSSTLGKGLRAQGSRVRAGRPWWCHIRVLVRKEASLLEDRARLLGSSASGDDVVAGCGQRPREPLTPAGERLVRDVAAQAGLVLRNVALIEDLRASRQRLVAAADEARRGLERNLHDGAQQQLVALRISLTLARQVLAGSPAEAADLLAQTEHQAEEALQELRDLAHGIYPPLLADLRLGAALEAQARKAAVPVTIEAPAIGRYPQETEAAVYFCVLEALQHIAKYAHAPAARVTLRQDAQGLTLPWPMRAPASTRPPPRSAPDCRASPTGWRHSAAPSTSLQPPGTARGSPAGYPPPTSPALTVATPAPALEHPRASVPAGP